MPMCDITFKIPRKLEVIENRALLFSNVQNDLVRWLIHGFEIKPSPNMGLEFMKLKTRPLTFWYTWYIDYCCCVLIIYRAPLVSEYSVLCTICPGPLYGTHTMQTSPSITLIDFRKSLHADWSIWRPRAPILLSDWLIVQVFLLIGRAPWENILRRYPGAWGFKKFVSAEHTVHSTSIAGSRGITPPI